MTTEVASDVKQSGLLQTKSTNMVSTSSAFTSGIVSGICSTVLLQPLDLVKTRLQTQSLAAKSGGRHYGMFYTLYAVVRRERITGLWKGLVPSISRTVPGTGVYFCSLYWLQSRFLSDDQKAWQSIMLGTTARSIAGISLLPVTVVKTRFESGHFQYKSVAHALSSIWKTEGSKGLFSGLSATLVRDAPFSGLYLMFYTETKKFAKSALGVVYLNPAMLFVCGIMGGALASIITQPADVVKTRMQISPTRYSGNFETFMSIIRSDGVMGIFRGIVPNTLRRTLMCAMSWVVYEELMRHFGHHV